MSDLPAAGGSAVGRAITLGAATVLIATQTIAACVAGGWAIGGFLGLGEIVTYALEIGGFALGVWIVVKFVRTALKHNPVR
ncbi:hypothetical protein ACFSCV_08520 [Methylopila henanensis]|uniref:Holin n=1 Tax=Methylopila henanensis TaxID=873516 RepID=A0ABW4K7W3_9HYPH